MTHQRSNPIARLLVPIVVGLVVSATVVVWSSATQGQESADAARRQPQGLGAEVDSLVRQLRRGSLADRNKVEQKLKSLGPAALPYLPPPDSDMPAELKVRLQRIIGDLERQSAESIWKASRFKLQGERTIGEWFGEITRQTGNKLSAEDLPEGKLELAFESTDFWPGLDRLLDKWQLDVDIYGGEPGTLTIVGRSPKRRSRAKRAVYTGPIRVEPTRVVTSRDVRTTGPPTARLELELAWEPRLAPIAVRFPLLEFFTVDDKGKLYECISPDATPTFPVRPGMSAVTLAVPFPAPPRDVKRWSRVGGVCQLLVPGEQTTFQFADLTKPATKRQAGVQVSFEGARENGDVWEVRLKLEYDEAFTGLDSHRGWVQDNPIYLTTTNGKREEPLGLQLTSQTRNSMGFAFLFDLSQELNKYQLHYATPAKILRREVNFDMSEIDLP